jgi:hypothetical protein
MNWIERQVHEVSLKRMLAAAAVFGVVAIALLLQARYFTNYFKGTYAISPAELAAAKDAEALDRYWVRLNADKIHDTGFEEITVRKKHGVERSRSISASYFVAVIGDRLLLVKAHGDTPNKSLQGFLRPIAEKVDQSFFDSPSVQKVKPAFYPMLLDTGDFKSDGDLGMGIAGLLSAAALIFGLMGFLRFRNPQGHPAVKLANTWGGADKVSQSIETDLKGGQVAKLGDHTITAGYIVNRSMLDFSLVRLDDAIWVFKQIIQNKLYYVIPTGKTFSLSINTPRKTLVLKGKEANVDAALQHIGTRKPWIILGFSSELAAAYKKKRSEMIAWVAKRRQEVQASMKEQATFAAGMIK